MYPAEITSKEVSFAYTFSPKHSRAFGVQRCLDCTHVFCSPIPDDMAANYADVVDEEYLKHQVSREVSGKASAQVIQKQVRSGKLLDVGCATGDFLMAAKGLGFQAEGLEPSHWSSEIARNRGLTVHRDFLETFADKHPHEYDVVTLWGVIEHFADPVAQVKNMKRLLKPGGIIALWTGDVDSITSRLLRRRWWYWQGQHIQYFTHQSIQRLFEDQSFEHLKTGLYPFGATHGTISNSLRRYPAHKLLSALIKPVFVLKPSWLLRLPGEMFFMARTRS
jgi:ubiquinone/menaquinone biosynthesis C-methylase UbiE